MQYVLLVVVALFALTACGGGNQSSRAPEPDRPNDVPSQNESMHTKAEEAVRISEQEPGVERAHAVVHDTATILVGVVLASDMDAREEQKRQFEQDLEDRITRDVEGVQRVVVTTEEEHTGRIRDIERDVKSGKADVSKHTKDVFNRLQNMRR